MYSERYCRELVEGRVWDLENRLEWIERDPAYGTPGPILAKLEPLRAALAAGGEALVRAVRDLGYVVSDPCPAPAEDDADFDLDDDLESILADIEAGL